MPSPEGNYSSADYEQFVQELIVPSIENFKIADHQPLVARMTYRQQVPLGQKTFKIPRLEVSEGIADYLGEYGKASYAKDAVSELEVAVERRGTGYLLTKDSIDSARLEGVFDPINRAVDNALRVMDRTYASTMIDAMEGGWGGGLNPGDYEDAPPYAGRTFTGHTHVVDYRTGNGQSLTPQALDLAIILDAKDNVAEHGYVPDTIFMSHKEHTELVLLMDSTDAESLLEEAQVEGSIGRILGLDIFVTPWLSDKQFIVADSGAKPIVFAEREGLSDASEFDPLSRLLEGQMHASWAFAVVEEWAGAIYYHD